MPFEKGHKSENNNKQQKYSAWSFGRWARTQTMAKVQQRMLKLLDSEDDAIVLATCKELMNRAIGKVPDQYEMAGPQGGPLRVTFEVIGSVKEQKVIELDEQSGIQALPQTASRLRK